MIFIVNTLFNIVLFLSNGIQFNEFAYLRPPIHFFYSKSFAPFFYFCFFFWRVKFDRPFCNKHTSNSFFNLFDSMSLIKKGKGMIT